MIPLAQALAAVEASPDHRVLRRLPESTYQIMPGVETRRGLYLDCESTGLDVKVDEVIEFGAIPFRFTLDGLHVEALRPIHQYNEPRKAITEEITKLTGITADMVLGKRLDVTAIDAVLDETDLVIAHNAEFDRPMMERVSPKFADKHWGCSMIQVPWGSGRRLEYILNGMGYFYDAHNAVSDCRAGLFAISQPLGERTGLAHILDASRAKAYRVWAIDSPFESKDALKKRGYLWNGGEDGRSKSWHKELTAADNEALEKVADEEEAWLKTIYPPKPYRARFDRVTAKERFTKRG